MLQYTFNIMKSDNLKSIDKNHHRPPYWQQRTNGEWVRQANKQTTRKIRDFWTGRGERI